VRWKYGVGFCSVNALAIATLLLWPQRQLLIARLGAAVCLGVAVASLFLNARNTFLCLSLSGVLMAITSIPSLRRYLISAWDKRGAILLVSVMGVTYLVGAIYVEGASRGVFGDEAQSKLKAQDNDAFGPVLGALAGGRSEFNASFAAIGDSPILGYGSWARSAYYYNIYVESIRETGTPEQLAEINSRTYSAPQIPTHSHLFGAWVEAGIVGAAFWLMVLRRALQATRRSLELRGPVDVLILLNTVFFMWNILFSPFGGEMRLVNASLLALFLFDLARPGVEGEPETASVAA